MSFANRMQKVATKLLTKFDERETPIKLIVLGVGTVFDYDLGEYVTADNTEYNCTGVAITVSQSLVNGTTIQSSDKMVTVSVNVGVVPTTADKLLIDGEQWSIVDTPHADYTSIDKAVVYKMQARK